MADYQFSLDDPRLTAYLLGELDDAERVEFEACLDASPQAQAALVEFMELTGSLSQALVREPGPALSTYRRNGQQKAGAVVPAQIIRPSEIPIPASRKQRWWGAGTIAACCLLGGIVLWSSPGLVDNSSLQLVSGPSTAHSSQLAYHDTEGTSLRGRDASGLALDSSNDHVALNQTPIEQAHVPTDPALQVSANGQLNQDETKGLKFTRLGIESETGVPATRESITLTDSVSEVEVGQLAQSTSGQPRLRMVGNSPAQQSSSVPPAPYPSDAPYDNAATTVIKGAPVPNSGASLVQSSPSVPTYPSAYDFSLATPTPAQQPGQPTPPAVTGGMVRPKDGFYVPLRPDSTRDEDGATPLNSVAPAATPPAAGTTDRGALVQSKEPSQTLLTVVPRIIVSEEFPESLEKAVRESLSDNPGLELTIPYRQGTFSSGIPPVQSSGLQTNAGGELKELARSEPLSRDFYFRRQEALRSMERSRQLINESYAPIVENEFITPQQAPFSTFGVDVDTAAYSNVRRFLDNNQWPPGNAVRLEELINAFSYSVPAPTETHPVNLVAETGTCWWQPKHQLVRISVKGKEINRDARPATSLVFLIDKSGSMSDANKLPLLKDSLRLLVEELHEQDRISIVTYANGAELLLEGAVASDRTRIMNAIDSLNADGSTNGEAGLKLAYEAATRNFLREGANRILVCTDGDFNVGTSEDDALFRMIGEKRQTGVYLSILGFGSGNIKDSKLEGIADRGNGQYVYIDSLKEARRVLVEQLTGTLYTIAKDVKLQVEFNPHQVAYYRLLGYENRTLTAEEFNNDRIDAGDMGAGHTVTAFYEVVPAGLQPPGIATVDQSRYATPVAPAAPAPEPADNPPGPASTELLFVKLRYKLPTSDESVKLDFPVARTADLSTPSNDWQWGANVAAFGMLLRDSKFKGQANWDELLNRTRESIGNDPTGQRREFVDMVFRARSLWRQSHGESPGNPTPLASGDARQKATCGGKYSDLLDKLEIPDDAVAYGEFQDFGKWQGNTYKGHGNLPEGYWVYVYPHWYIWGDLKQ